MAGPTIGGLFIGPDPIPGTNSPATIYVDLNNTSGTEDGTITFPFSTLQAGVDAAWAVPGNRALIIVRPGRYAEDVDTPDPLTTSKFIGIVGSGRLHPASVRSLRVNPPTPAGQTLQLSMWEFSIGDSAAAHTVSPLRISGKNGTLFFNLIDSSVLTNANGIDAVNISSANLGLVSLNMDKVQIFPSGSTLASGIVAGKGRIFGRAEITGIGRPAVDLSGSASLNLNNDNIITSGAGIDAIVNSGTGGVTLANVAIFVEAASTGDAVDISGIGVTLTIGNVFFVRGGGTGGFLNPGGVTAHGLVVDDAGAFPPITGAAVVLLALARSIGYTPTTPANWPIVPTEARGAFDSLAERRTHALIVNRSVSPTDSTSSAVFVTLQSSALTAFTGRPVLFLLDTTLFADTIATAAEFAIQIDAGADSPIGLLSPVSTANKHEAATGAVILTPTAGNHTINLRWRRSSGTGTLSMDANDQRLVHAVELG